MATVLRLANENGSTEVDLYSGTFKVDDWITYTPDAEGTFKHVPYGAQPSFEQYGINVELMALATSSGTSVSTIIAGQQAIFEALEGARRFHDDPHEYMSWWLEANADGETTRRSLLYKGSMQMLSKPVNPLLTCNAARAQLSLSRHPFWENDYHTTQYEYTVDVLGDARDFTNIKGDVLARPYAFQISGDTGGPLTEFWAGFRPEYWNTANFEPTWECEDGSMGTDSSVTDPDALARGSKSVRCDFSTETGMDKRLRVSVAQVCTANGHNSWLHQVGSYTALLRCKVTAGTIGVRLGQAYYYSPDTDYILSEEQFLTHTSYKLVDMGVVEIVPGGNYRWSTSDDTKQYTLAIFAEQVSGSGSLDVDCIILVPNRHSFYASGCQVSQLAGTPLYIYTGEDDRHIARGYFSGDPNYNINFSPSPQWGIPNGDSVLVVAGQRDGARTLGDKIDLTVLYIPRWSMYEGS